MTQAAQTIVAFQGEHGAYSEEAAQQHYGTDLSTLPCESFEEVFSSVRDGAATEGLVPIENSLAGSVHRNYDLLMRHELHIVGETHLRIRHCLLALPGTSLEAVRIVSSHPQALAQCERFLRSLKDVDIVPAYDTAGSAKALRSGEKFEQAAIAAERAADVYDLQILARGIEDDPSNYTRFLALAPEPVQPEGEAKTSIAFSLDNQPGILYEALCVFASREIDLTKIESRPIVGKPWEYMFYLDFVSEPAGNKSKDALEELDSMTTSLRVLGTFERHFWEN